MVDRAASGHCERMAWSLDDLASQGNSPAEPETGYFFAAEAADNEHWTVHFAPDADRSFPSYRRVPNATLLSHFEIWAKTLAGELSTSKALGHSVLAGSNIFTLGQIQEIYQLAADAGVTKNSLTFTHMGFQFVRIGLAHSEHFFELRCHWRGRFEPGKIHASQQFERSNWNQTKEEFKNWLEYTLRELNTEFPPASPNPAELPEATKPNLTLTSLRLKNSRKFRDVTIDLHPELNLFCGRNGTGKSTILRCLALALCHEADTAAILADVPGDLVSVSEEQGEIEVTALDQEQQTVSFRVEFKRSSDRDVLAEQSKHHSVKEPFLCGYGSGLTLLTEHTPSEYNVREATSSLYTYGAKLFSLEVVLRRMRDRFEGESYNRLLRQMSDSLGFPGIPQIRPGRGVEFIENGHPGLPFEGLADGFRVSLSWLIDLYGWAMLDEALLNGRPNGVLLCDEVDKHMHPELQAELVGNLHKLLPSMQLFFTTHNPLTVLGCKPESLHILEQGADGVTCRSAPDYHGYSVEDIYTDPRLFSVEPFSPDVQRLIEEYKQLVQVAPEERTEDQNLRLRETAQQMQILQVDTL